MLIGLVIVALLGAACGSSEASDDASPTDTEASTTTAEATTTTEATAEPTTTTAAPEETGAADPDPLAEGRTFVGADGVETDVSDTSRIVSLNGDITEIIYELGLGDSVVAIDVTTTHPEPATELPVVGFGQDLAAEGVLAFQPTLVIGDQQIEPAETLQQLRDAGVPVAIIETATSLDGVVPKINTVAEILGVDGATLAGRVQGEIDDAIELASAAADTPDVAFVYARGPQVILLFGAGMPTQSIIESAGATDVGAASGVFGAAPLTPEALVAAAPEVIVLPDAGLGALGGPEAFAAVPGVAETPAGADGSFLAYDEAFFFNLGPRAGQALRQFVLDLHPELG
jgi:iron complex transport system substrate-binding protein